MKQLSFTSAKAIFHPSAQQEQVAVSQYGFYYPLELTASEKNSLPSKIVIKLTARNLYRLYVNGNIVMNGPARSAHGYSRVDIVNITEHVTHGINHIAVEVVAYGRDWKGYHHYSNDCTLEDGLFIAEIEADGKILAPTGKDKWSVLQITARSPIAERISHSRECIEIYTLSDEYYLWKQGIGEFTDAVTLSAPEPIYLAREALLPSLEEYRFRDLIQYTATQIAPDMKLTPFFFETDTAFWSAMPERPTMDCRRTVENKNGHVKAYSTENGLTLCPINTDSYLAMWEHGESRVGFIRLSVTCERAGIIDIVRSEAIEPDGICHHSFNNVTRLHVQAGKTELVTMEPALARYMIIHFRGVGAATVHSLSILDFSYPDQNQSSFICSDDNVNRLYKSAKKTLLLNTLVYLLSSPVKVRLSAVKFRTSEREKMRSSPA